MASTKKTLHDVIERAGPAYRDAARRGLMRVRLRGRAGKTVTLPSGQPVVEFVNCSYLGFDQHPDVVKAAQDVLPDWGVHFCCARSRFTIDENDALEERLSNMLGGHAITFPSVTTAHMSAMPLMAAGVLFPNPKKKKVRLIFDRFAHASMRSLKALLEKDAEVVTLGHNDIAGARAAVEQAERDGVQPVYVADGVYSMGGVCELEPLIDLITSGRLCAYIDDAHGTSIFGARGEGFAIGALGGTLPENVAVTFSLSKGFGTNGGGIVVGGAPQEETIRSFGQTYAFSAPLDFSIVGAAHAVLDLHDSGEAARLSTRLRQNVARFDKARGVDAPFSPIRMVPMPSAEAALDAGDTLIAAGFFVTVALYPVVPENAPQLRICITAPHTDDEIDGLCAALDKIQASFL